ncbi:hypothetical protein E2C01_054046 [Portunus trituberculatus]|uniref:Uncharacterized protein n=1 Tax=Portunus trituberculatus TaxID=210409 RepID=A0A5B7GIU5_PORTR|nr:hypothetical protein [Portunus trituberculatus]
MYNSTTGCRCGGQVWHAKISKSSSMVSLCQWRDDEDSAEHLTHQKRYVAAQNSIRIRRKSCRDKAPEENIRIGG